MDPIFSYDFQRFVLQDPLINAPKPIIVPKPFDIEIKSPEKSDKTKKDLKKEKDPEKEKKKRPFNL